LSIKKKILIYRPLFSSDEKLEPSGEDIITDMTSMLDSIISITESQLAGHL